MEKELNDWFEDFVEDSEFDSNGEDEIRRLWNLLSVEQKEKYGEARGFY